MYRKRKRNDLLIAVVILTAGCSEQQHENIFSQDAVDVSRISGELFLNGPDEQRVTFTIFGQQAQSFVSLLATATPSQDRKSQGIASFKVYYLDGGTDFVEVAEKGLLRVRGKGYQADENRMLEVLRAFNSGDTKHNSE